MAVHNSVLRKGSSVAKQDYLYTYYMKSDLVYMMCMYSQSIANLLSKYFEGDTKSVLFVGGTYYWYWLT